VVIAVGPGGYFNPDTSAPQVLAAYTLFPEGQAPRGVTTLVGPPNTSAPGREPPEISAPSTPVSQPIPFSHKRHMQTEVKCDNCHPIMGTGERMQMPTLDGCLQCHRIVLQYRSWLASRKNRSPVRGCGYIASQILSPSATRNT